MKKIIIASVLAFSFLSINAQDNLTIKSTMKLEGMPEGYEGMSESDMVVFIKGDKSKTEVSSMMGTQTFVNDGKKTTILIDQMGNKMGYVITKEEQELEEKNEPKNTEKPTIEYVDEKLTVAGYECKKAMITNVSGKEKVKTVTTVWYTDKIKSQANKKQSKNMPDFGELTGYPMKYEGPFNIMGMELKRVVTATEVSESNIDEATFVPSTEGFNLKTYKELKEESKKMQGGQ